MIRDVTIQLVGDPTVKNLINEKIDMGQDAIAEVITPYIVPTLNILGYETSNLESFTQEVAECVIKDFHELSVIWS